MIRVAMVFVLLGIGAAACSAPDGLVADDAGMAADLGRVGIWHPPIGASWDWQLETPVKRANVMVMDIDGFDNHQPEIDRLHFAGIEVICYIDVGSSESYRPDFKKFPPSVLGNVYSGFPNERWLDIRRIDLLSPIMGARFDMAQSKGCDGIEPDNMDGFDIQSHEASGFPLTAGDQLTYNRWVATEVHARGMAVGLKNDLVQLADLVGEVDFLISEQTFQYHDQQLLAPMLAAGKPVFEAEYSLPLAKFCPDANRLNVSAIRKHPSLDAYREACR